MKKLLLTTLFAVAVASGHAMAQSEDLLVQGTQTISTYNKEVNITSGDRVVIKEFIPGTYSVGTAVFLRADGTCYERTTELVKLHTFDTGRQQPDIDIKEKPINCPS